MEIQKLKTVCQTSLLYHVIVFLVYSTTRLSNLINFFEICYSSNVKCCLLLTNKNSMLLANYVNLQDKNLHKPKAKP